MSLRKTIKALLPSPMVEAIRRYRTVDSYKRFRDPSAETVFSKVYASGIWGNSNDPEQPFFSGTGSHDQRIVQPYIEAMQAFLSTMAERPDVVDLGCGDFFVGCGIRNLCNKYVACDVVPALIAFNRKQYKALDVDFRVLDITNDALPKADIAIIRQVFQHLSNEQILQALPRILSTYKYIILTEHWPAREGFEPNVDKPAGPDIRLGIDSGIVLTRPPFSIPFIEQRTICQVEESGSLIVTTVFRLKA